MYALFRPLFLLFLTLFMGTTLTLPLGQTKSAMTFKYGVHFPNGVDAVNYIYGPDGTWKNIDSAEYKWNYYSRYSTFYHPYDKISLLSYANGSHFTIAPDANGHQLSGINQPRVTGKVIDKAAFYEHNGKGAGNRTLAPAFTNFWFDDNWLARYMSIAYGKPEPDGLSDYNDFNRWQILGGDTSHWFPYNQDYFDTLALDGLYSLAKGDSEQALKKWQRLRDKSRYTYDEAMQRFRYPNISENYHLGLFKILTDKLLYESDVADFFKNELLQHSISLRSNILSNQEQEKGLLFGWTSAIGKPNSLINTETVAVNTLALGASAAYTFEAGKAPFFADSSFYQREHNVLSAVKKFSLPGYMTNGPGIKLPVGVYNIDFMLRTTVPLDKEVNVAHLSVLDSATNTILAQRDVTAADVNGNDKQWKAFSLLIKVDHDENQLEFRTYWNGTTGLDIAYIQVRVAE